MSLYDRVGQTVTVLVDRDLISGADPDRGVGRANDRESTAIEVTGLLRTITVNYQAELDVDGHLVTFDVDDAAELDASRA